WRCSRTTDRSAARASYGCGAREPHPARAVSAPAPSPLTKKTAGIGSSGQRTKGGHRATVGIPRRTQASATVTASVRSDAPAGRGMAPEKAAGLTLFAPAVGRRIDRKVRVVAGLAVVGEHTGAASAHVLAVEAPAAGQPDVQSRAVVE